MSLTLKIAAIYNLLWGVWVVLFPNHFFELVGMTLLNLTRYMLKILGEISYFL